MTIATTALLICGGFVTYSMIAFRFVEVGGAPRGALTRALLLGGIASMCGNAFPSHVVRALHRDRTIVAGISFTAACFTTLWLALHFYWSSYSAFVCFGGGWRRGL